MASREGTYFLLINRGELVTDRFSREYGQVLWHGRSEWFVGLCPQERGHQRLCREATEIENRRRQKEEELERSQLIARQDGTFFEPATS